SKSTASSLHSRRMISSPSSVLRPRVLVSRFRVRHSGASGLPMPKAGNSRPSDNTSIVAHCLAKSTGSRKANDSTLTPNLIRRVRPASAAITLMHSRIGSRLIMRSVCHSESTPPASHRSTQRQNPATPEHGNSIRPSPIATFLGIFVLLGRPRQFNAEAGLTRSTPADLGRNYSCCLQSDMQQHIDGVTRRPFGLTSGRGGGNAGFRYIAAGGFASRRGGSPDDRGRGL